MRKLVLGMVLAAGAALPTIAIAQDRPPEGRQHEGGERPHEGGRPPQQAQQQRQAPAQPRQQAAPQAQPQVQAQAQARAGGGDPRRGDQGNRPPNFRGGDGNQPGRGYGNGQGGYRAQGGVTVAPGSGGYRGQGGPQVAPGSGGYRAQGGVAVAPGSGGYRPQGGPPIAPGSGGYRPQGGYGGYGNGGYRPAPQQQGGGWNRGWRGDQRFDWGRYRNENRFAFHLPRYYAPGGWNYGYRRFSAGYTLNSLLFVQDYWIDDPYDYRLPPAYGPYRWVRYYNDALLVDIRNGYVVDVVNNIFW